MEMIVKDVGKNDFLGRKIKIMSQQDQLESALSTYIFQASKTKAIQLLTDSIITFLANQVAHFGISMQQ